MTQQDHIREIEDRARKAYSSVSAVCRRANIAQSTFARWKASPNNRRPTAPNLDTLAKVYAALEAIEAECAAELDASRGVAA